MESGSNPKIRNKDLHRLFSCLRVDLLLFGIFLIFLILGFYPDSAMTLIIIFLTAISSLNLPKHVSASKILSHGSINGLAHKILCSKCRILRPKFSVLNHKKVNSTITMIMEN